MSRAVIFVARGIGGGSAAARAFFDSYHEHPAGMRHDLIVVAKGWETEPGLEALRRWTAEASGTLVELPDDGFDLGAYLRMAAALSHEWLCLLNTHARPTAEDWLAKLLSAAAQSPSCGAAGATGSWGTLTPRLSGPGVSVAGALAWPPRFAMQIRRFPKFPNPHLRSNGLVLRRELLLDFARQSRMPRRKSDAHFLESGRGGLTRFLLARGLAPRVAGADGNVYEAPEWAGSQTFRVPEQRNLLISDNQTRFYAAASPEMRRILEFAAWGRIFTP